MAKHLRYHHLLFYPGALCLLLLFHKEVHGQNFLEPIPDSSRIYQFRHDYETPEGEAFSTIDTLIGSVHTYDPKLRNGFLPASTGPIGQPYKPLLLSLPSAGFSFRPSPLGNYLFSNDCVPSYLTGKPFTHLFYIMGLKKEQNLSIEHSQNVLPNVSVGLSFRLSDFPGYYPQQATENKNLNIRLRYKTGNNRYGLQTHYLHNKIRLRENGGILYDSIFEQNLETSRDRYEIRLSEAMNRIRENGYFLKQYFRLARPKTDTSASKRIFFSLPGMITHSVLISRHFHVYEDEMSGSDTAFYPHNYYSSATSYDSVSIRMIENRLTWTNMAAGSAEQVIGISAGLRHQYAELSGYMPVSYFRLFIPFITLGIAPFHGLNFGFHGEHVAGEGFGGDYVLQANAGLSGDFGKITFSSELTGISPGYFYREYASNHYRWSNDFRRESYITQNLDYSCRGWHAQLSHTEIRDAVYLDTLAQPVQKDGNVSYLKAYVGKNMVFRRWGLDIRLYWQDASDDEIFRFPQFMAYGGLHYTRELFRQALRVRAGAECYFHSGYFADAYTPATISFYRQNVKRVGEYPFTNLFLTLQIKRSRIFLKYDNLLYLAGQFTYYTVPDYPLQDGGFRFGVSWMFYD